MKSIFHAGTRSRRHAVDRLRRRFPDLYAWLIRHHPAGVMLAARDRALTGDHDGAIRLARRRLGPGQAHALEILQANHALSTGDRDSWLAHLNAYLAHFSSAPLQLEGGDGQHILTRLSAVPSPAVTGGPLVSVLMPVWNAERTVAAAARSILTQTWRNLELLVVDDASEDGTWAVLQEIASRDSRVRLRRNRVNVGPYVSKNIALTEACGQWITGHDADDWAHPGRIAGHVAAATGAGAQASVIHMLRICPDGSVTRLSRTSENSPDGVARACFVSCLFDAAFLRERLGHWDSVRFGADSEIMSRARRLTGRDLPRIPIVGLLCLDLPGSLTNQTRSGMSQATGLSPIRQDYRQAFLEWHRSLEAGQGRMPFPLQVRPFPAPAGMIVPPEAAAEALAAGAAA